MISKEQIAFFQTFGFLFLPKLFSSDEMCGFSERFDELLGKERDGEPFPGQTRQSLYRIAEIDPLFTRLVIDDRIYNIVESLLGHGFMWLCSEGNLYVGDTQWHPDGSRLDYRPMKVSLYLDALTEQAGCLRVIPGSHRLPFHEELRAMSTADFPGTEIPCISLDSHPGDVLFADMNTWHASFGGRPARRHLAMNFVPEPTSQDDIEVLEQNYQGVLRNIDSLQYSKPGRVFSDAFLCSDNPRVKRLVSRWVDMGLR